MLECQNLLKKENNWILINKIAIDEKLWTLL